ncbi:hypothetical protein NXV73_04425 [Bacteroides salyersiae]|jgi:hypothetical protein|uniref:Uncharacterized protein n=1 Tax=Bacteroides salyersiae CL02T12C01 TaxID=997887 RepID=I8Z3V4_9BACE|nr:MULTISPECIES: hypothetical protein [Bacteroides]EIY69582.1 hypothetical protein HMPREF1071_00602 [Bacteroides salyersiae CL02T12C01]EOA51141.1 hypothetical protein HMPREF1532_00994 [Bacteroides salyersiae WAL 10018 = DSM 18765 = JCM 12988]KAB5348602.1 hypothetical protein GAA62_07615 [Bacteroides salyersiae]KAB5355044.1 hypothetical protein GAA37_04215 [Bacteroides salyersiae]KAB5360876.1 hypothetical protein F9967_11270 [Bacteroides salyersiae]
MLDKAEDYFKDEEFVGYFVEVVTDVLIGSDVSGCEDMTLQDVSDKVKGILLPSSDIEPQLSVLEVDEIKRKINETIKTESNT